MGSQHRPRHRMPVGQAQAGDRRQGPPERGSESLGSVTDQEPRATNQSAWLKGQRPALVLVGRQRNFKETPNARLPST